ncbi:PREDICTED: mucin-2 [Rhagoletis zephyria]|uniref:mucin-2 n=1 Tax=Rhagoletis zephyria TaxID=28612 RepID=UPI00081181BD|nr:PREDICTED: mucin-2 [Rhagoletis zephyria]
MNKQPSYTNEHSLNSQYGYNAWGIWRDGRNIAPSTFSAKTHTHYQKPRSFSIILTTAVFIVLLAVISIAGLAFYFSSVKANLEDPVLGFEGSFRIAKGDLFSTGLKYNHTTTYKQKIEFYKRFVERSLMDNGLQPLRVDTWGFGEGPLIKVFFRTFLDVRKLPQNIHSVEDYIKESLFLETTATKSLYRSLRIDADSVEIKRILDESVVRSASLFKDAMQQPTSQSQLEKRLIKKPNTPSLLSKPATTVKTRTTHRPHSADDEPEVDVENAPVIQGSFEGSFEITKTDADISRKKATMPTKAYTSLAPKAVTPFALRVKPKKPSIEKMTTIIPQHQQTMTTLGATSTSTTRATSTTKATTTTSKATTKTTSTSTRTTATTRRSTTSTSTSSTSAPITTTSTTTLPPSSSTTTTSTTTTTTAPTTTIKQITFPPPTAFAPKQPFTLPTMTTPSMALTVPKLDANLFTSIPVLDTQPWRPIHREVPELLPGPPPAYPTKTLTGVDKPMPVASLAPAFRPDMPTRRIDEIELPFIPENPSPPTPPAFNPYAPGFFGTAVRKPEMSAEAPNPQDMLFYHSFGNPVFMPGTEDIERLGAGAHVKPHPLPVPLIDDVVIPPFKPLIPDMEKVPVENGEKFEHLGGGVIMKKHELEQASGEQKSKPNVGVEPSDGETEIPELTEKTLVHSVTTTTYRPKYSTPNINRIESSANSELADTIGEFFMGLLKIPKDETRNVTKVVEEPEEPNESATDAPTESPIESRVEPDENNKEKEPESDSKVVEEDEVVATTESESTAESDSTAEQESEIVQVVEKPVEEIVTEVSTTAKPTFLNIKELILKRNQAKNQTRNIENNITGRPTPTTTPPTATSTSSTPAVLSTTTYTPPASNWHRIRPSYNQKPPTILDDSSLFPSQTKWEFMNSSSANSFGHTGNMRKVFNKTLQAWISEDVGSGTSEDNFTLDDIKTRINNATNIQDISLIFDTLASKLGITPIVPTKVPPFSQNKLKHPQVMNESRTKLPTTGTGTGTATTTTPPMAIRDRPTTTVYWMPTTRRGTITAVPAAATKMPWTTTRRITTTTTTTSTSTTTTTNTPPTVPALRTRPAHPTAMTTPTTTTTTKAPLPAPMLTATTEEDFIELPLQRREPFIKPMSSFMEDTSSEGIGAAIPVVGEAEVEVIDPNKYEEMLKSSQFAADTTTETAPQLVTLLPVRSNSGIRTYRPTPEESVEARSNDQLPIAVVEAMPLGFELGTAGDGQVEVVPETVSELTGIAEPVEAVTEAVPTTSRRPSAVSGPRRSGGLGVGGGFFAGIRRKSDISQARRFPPAEAIVKGGLQVKVK